MEDKDKMIKASTALKDQANIAKLRSICSVSMKEGCFCPKGTVLHNGKCLREAECRACDAEV
jgi:Trypsin Inhibitor like cysteine rich domain